MSNQKNKIVWNQYLESKLVEIDYSITNSYDAIKKIIETKSDILLFPKKEIYLFMNISLLELEMINNVYMYSFACHKKGDFIQHIQWSCTIPDTEFFILIDRKEYSVDQIDELLFVCSPHSDIRYQFIFKNLPNIQDQIQIEYLCGILNEDMLKLPSYHVFTNTHKYVNGLCYPLNE
jgi:hypothetical protein